MAASDEVELQVEELMVSSSLDALCHVAQKLDLNKKYWEGKPKLTVIKAIRKCYDVSDSEVKKTLLVSITNALNPVAASAPPPNPTGTPSPQKDTTSFTTILDNSMFRREFEILDRLDRLERLVKRTRFPLSVSCAIYVKPKLGAIMRKTLSVLSYGPSPRGCRSAHIWKLLLTLNFHDFCRSYVPISRKSLPLNFIRSLVP